MERPLFERIDPRYEHYFRGHTAQVKPGAFAVVSLVDATSVIKATCCLPSAKFLTFLQTNESSGRQYTRRPVAGLPRVFEALGPIAKDADGHSYFGFRMERLFDMPQPDGLRDAAYTQKQLLMGKLSAAFSAYHRNQNNHHQDLEFTDTAASIEVARRLANDSTNLLGQGFGFIATFLAQQTEPKAVMDLMRPENLMFSREGELILADPVAGVYDELGLNVPSPNCTTYKRPTGTNGLRCSTKAMAVTLQNCTAP